MRASSCVQPAVNNQKVRLNNEWMKMLRRDIGSLTHFQFAQASAQSEEKSTCLEKPHRAAQKYVPITMMLR
jgi:hypothetical protein